MSINISELIWTVICFLVLLFVLKKLLFDPIVRFMDERNADVESGLEEGRQAKQALDDNAAALSQAKKEAARQAGVLVQQAKSEDEKARQEAIAATKQETAQALKDVRAQLREEEGAVSEALEGELPELVDILTGALMKESR